MYAWEKNLKGITIWRDNCQRQSILSTSKKEIVETSCDVFSKKDLSKDSIDLRRDEVRGYIIPAGDHWLGLKRTLVTGCGTLHCTAYFDPNNGELRECYLSKGSTGGCNNFMVGLSRMISLAARGGVGIEAILDQLKSCGVCPSYAVRQATRKDCSKGSCCPVAVGNALKEMYEEMQEIICECKGETPVLQFIEADLDTPKNFNIIPKRNFYISPNLEECPNCHEKTLIHQGGCVSCPSCSYTKCD